MFRHFALAGALVLSGLSHSAAPAPPQPASNTLHLSLRGLALGREQFRLVVAGSRTELTTSTRFSFGAGLDVAGILVTENGAPVSLQVDGSAPPFLPVAAAVRVAPDQPDFYPIRSPFPVSIVGALVRQSMATGRKEFRTLAEAPATIEACPPAPAMAGVSSCHLVTGLTWGAMQVWFDSERLLAGAVIPTPWGPIIAARAEFAYAHERMLADFARATASRLHSRVAGAAPPAGGIAFTNIRIIDPATDQVRVGTIHTAAGRILGAGGATAVPEGARVIDGSGLSALPGLWDMHAHLKQADWGPAYLASGVTSARDVGNDEAFITALRAEQRSGRFPSPRLWLAAFIDARSTTQHTSVQANTPEEGRALVRRYAKAGFDQIKVWNNVRPDVLPHIVDEAHRAGLRVTRHAPSGARAIESLDAGVDHIDHLDALLEAAEGDLQSSAGRALLARLRARGVGVDPTLVVTEFANRSLSTPLSEIEPGILKAPAWVRLAWSSFGQPPERASAEPLHRAKRFVKQLYDAGVAIVVGSDQGVPGHTLQREIELLVEAGLTPMQAIDAATRVPARIMGVDDEVGQLRRGYRADLVIVEGNPAETIRDLRRVRYVMRDGILYQPGPLWQAVEFKP